MRAFFLNLLFWGCGSVLAQTGIGTNTPHGTSQLEVSSTNKGLLVPRMTHSEMNSISNPVAGLQVYNTTKSSLYSYNGSTWIGEKKYVGKFVSAGTAISLDNIQIRIPTSGNTAIHIATVSGSATISGSSFNVWNNYTISSSGATGSNESFTIQSTVFNTTFKAWQSGASFIKAGGLQVIYILDESNSKAYKLTFIHGSSSSNHYLEIEQLL